MQDERDAGGWLWHRPPREWPRVPDAEPVHVVAPPAATEDSGGGWQMLLPLVGSVSVIAFAFVVRSVAYLVVAGVLVVLMGGATVGARVVQKRGGGRRRDAARRRYRAGLAAARARSLQSAATFRDGLVGLHPAPGDLLAAVQAGGCFERRPGDGDFADVRVGLAALPAPAPVVVEDSPVTVEPDPALAADAAAVVAETATVPDAPVVAPLARLGVVGVVGPDDAARGLAGAWVASLAAFHAPSDLRLLALVRPDALPCWEWTKWLPHARDPLGGDGFGRVRRTVTTDRARFRRLLDPLVAARRDHLDRAALSRTGEREEPAGEHVVVLVDDDPSWLLTPELSQVLDDAAALHLTVVLLAADRAQLPASTRAWVELAADGTAVYREAGPGGRTLGGVTADRVDVAAAERLARHLAPLRLAGVEANADLVDTVRLVDLLGLEHAGTFDADASWLTVPDLYGPPPAEPADEDAPARPDPAGLLSAPIGIAADGSTIVLDVKEAAAGGMGPHGILVGATGSGKSELLRTLTAALAAGHDPELLAFVLVDFKGGAAFAGLEELPHVAGVITNLADDLTLVERVRAALAGELERRQELLRSAGNLDSIRDYHRLAAGRDDLPALPYLMVVVDEFGELLAARPEFLDTFVTIGRLGRSLGVHLLLATQRLDEGRIRGLEPHLRYRLGLRTFSAPESQAVLGNAAAFELPPLPGLGYLKVDAAQTRFKGALVTTPHRPPATPRVDLLAGTAVARPFRLGDPESADGDAAAAGAGEDRTDLDELVGRMQRDRGMVHQVWLSPLPKVLSLGELLAQWPDDAPALRAPVGLVDLPHRQAQVPLTVDLSGAGGNVAVVGAPRSGKTTALVTLVSALACLHPVDRLHVYCLDLAAGGLHALADLPHVGAVVGRHQPDAMARLLRELRALVDERAAAVRERRGEERPADVLLVVDGVGLLRSHHPELELEVTELAATGLQYGVHVVLAASRWLDIRPALLDALGTRIELRLNDPVDSQVGRAAASTVPADTPGRGLTREGHLAHVAWPSLLPVTDLARLEHGLPQLVTAVRRQEGDRRAPEITTLPTAVPAARVAADADGRFPLGIQEYRLAPVALDLLAPGVHLYVAGDPGSGRSTLLRRAVRRLVADPRGPQLHLVDPARALLDLADAPNVAGYAFTHTDAADLAARLAKELTDRLPPPSLTVAELRAGGWWSGPQHVLVVDDYDMLLSATGGPFGPLVDLLTYAHDVGLHVLLARRATGSQRTAFEPFGQRLREVTPAGLVLSGPPQEGPLVGDQVAVPQPPGRGFLVRRGLRTALVQCATDDAEVPA